jgi:parvulin-like peptidyl-prolyl isomerase
MSGITLISAEDVFSQVRLLKQLPSIREEIISRNIIAETAKKLKIEITSEEIQLSADEFRKINNLQRSDVTLAWLRYQGLSLEDFEVMIHDSALRFKLASHLFSEKAEGYFITHQLEYTSVVLYEVILEDEDIALELFYALNEKEVTFFEVTQKYIQDPELKRRGGYRGTLKRTDLLPEISSAIFASNPPQLLKPILTAYGIHLIYVEEISQPDFSEIRNNLILSLFSEWLNKETQTIIMNELDM